MDNVPLRMGSSVELLDPLMKEMMQGCSKETALKIKEILPRIDDHALQKLHPYIVVPILGEVVSKKLNKELKTVLLDCASEVLNRVHLTSVSVVKNILTMVMMEIFDKASPNMIKSVPEEMKLSVVNCAFAVIQNMPYDVQDKYYVKESIPEICQISYICLELAISEKLRSLRIRAMEVLLALQQVPLEGPDRRSPWERQVVADIFQFVFPGACSKLMSIISGDITQGTKVLSTAIFTLSSLIGLVMEDYISTEADDPAKMVATLLKLSERPNLQNAPENILEKTPRDAAVAKKLIESSQGRTPEWRKKASQNVLPYLSKIAEHCEHSDPKVCKVVAESCYLIILQSPQSLRDGLAPLLDAIVALSVHENEEVRERSVVAIKQLSESFSEQRGYDFIQLAEENLYMLLTRLPRLVQEEGSAKGASSVALLSGYVQLLRPSMRNVLSSAAHLQRLTLSLLHIVTLECSSVNVGNEHSMRELTPERCDDLNVPWTRLCLSSDRAVLANIQQLLNILAEKSMGVFDLLTSQLVDALHSVAHFRKESVLLLNMLLLSACKIGNESAQELATSLLEIYMNADLWQKKGGSESVTTVNRMQQEIATICLLTEGISCCIQALGKEKAQPHLLRILYPLLEQAGSTNNCRSLAGRRALTRVALSCDFNSNLVALISNNMDYLSHCMSVRLRYVNEHMGVLDALSLILRHSSPEIALGLNNIVVNVLYQSGDVSQSKNNEAHLRVFLTFALGVGQWLKPNNRTQATTYSCNEIRNTQKLDERPHESFKFPTIHCSSKAANWTAGKRLKEYLETLYPDSQNDSEEEQLSEPTEELPRDKQPHIIAEQLIEDGIDDAMDSTPNKKEELPELVKLLVSVLQRCLHFLPSQIVDHQFLAIRTLNVGLQALEPFTDSLLPMVHQIWGPLVERFHSKQEPLIIRTAFQLLQTMVNTAKDFLLSRTVKEVFPHFVTFLKNACSESHLKDSASAYRFSQRFKTQLTLLSGLGPLVCHLGVRSPDFYGLLNISLMYLSCYQPQPLQVAAVSFINCLFELDQEAVWWALVSWWTPPHLTEPLHLPRSSPHQDCVGNIRLLLGLPSKNSEDEEQQ